MSNFLSDKELEDLAKKIVSDLYNNKDIVDLKNNGRPLIGNIATLIERPISGIYSNITGHRSLHSILVNAIRYSVLVEKNMSLENEFKKLRETCERRKNMLVVINRKLETDKTNEQIKSEGDKIKLEVTLLEQKINEIAEKNSEPPTIRKNILDLAKKTYKLLLRSDKTSEKLFTYVCNQLGVKLDNDHFGYYQRNDNAYNNGYNNNYNSYNGYNGYNNGYNKQYQPRFQEEKKDVYVPPQLQYQNRRRY
jgi:hypothetical protein